MTNLQNPALVRVQSSCVCSFCNNTQFMEAQYRGNTLMAQRRRFHEALKRHAVTTVHARDVLDIFSPAPRVFELRALGFNIVTEWQTVTGANGKAHRQAQYVLMPGKPAREAA